MVLTRRVSEKITYMRTCDSRNPVAVHAGKRRAGVLTLRGLEGSDKNTVRREQIRDDGSLRQELGVERILNRHPGLKLVPSILCEHKTGLPTFYITGELKLA